MFNGNEKNNEASKADARSDDENSKELESMEIEGILVVVLLKL